MGHFYEFSYLMAKTKFVNDMCQQQRKKKKEERESLLYLTPKYLVICKVFLSSPRRSHLILAEQTWAEPSSLLKILNTGQNCGFGLGLWDSVLSKACFLPILYSLSIIDTKILGWEHIDKMPTNFSPVSFLSIFPIQDGWPHMGNFTLF